MGKIYACSSQLNIWLGEFDILEALGAPFAPWPDRQFNLKPSEAMMENMIDLQWFERRWVIQEVLHTSYGNRTIWIGDREISWNHFIYWVQVSVETPSIPEILKERRKVQEGGWKGEWFLENMHNYEYALCDDPRDYAYALLSISKDGQMFDVDYQSNAEVTYHRVAEQIIEYAMPDHIGALLIAAITRSRHDPNRGPPFWAPQWCHQRGPMTPVEEEANRHALIGNPRLAPTIASVIRSQDLRLRVWLFARGRGQDILYVQHSHPCVDRRGYEAWNTCPQCKARFCAEEMMHPGKRPVVKEDQVLCVLDHSKIGFVLDEYAKMQSEGMVYRPNSSFNINFTASNRESDFIALEWELMDVLIG